MQGAELTGTNLKGADMLDAEGLTTSQLEEAETDDSTIIRIELQ
jgi:hypothetical protein